MEYFLAILPAIVIISLILILAYLTQKSMRNKYITPLEDQVKVLKDKTSNLEKDLKQKEKEIHDLTAAFIELQSEVERMAVNEMKNLENNNKKDL